MGDGGRAKAGGVVVVSDGPYGLGVFTSPRSVIELLVLFTLFVAALLAVPIVAIAWLVAPRAKKDP